MGSVWYGSLNEKSLLWFIQACSWSVHTFIWAHLIRTPHALFWYRINLFSLYIFFVPNCCVCSMFSLWASRSTLSLSIFSLLFFPPFRRNLVSLLCYWDIVGLRKLQSKTDLLDRFKQEHRIERRVMIGDRRCHRGENNFSVSICRHPSSLEMSEIWWVLISVVF